VRAAISGPPLGAGDQGPEGAARQQGGRHPQGADGGQLLATGGGSDRKRLPAFSSRGRRGAFPCCAAGLIQPSLSNPSGKTAGPRIVWGARPTGLLG